MIYRSALAFAMLVTVPSAAVAQFTTFVPPADKPDSMPAAAVAAAVATDSATRIALTDMKAWVDSAAGIVATEPGAAAIPDSGLLAINTPAVSPESPTVSFSNGAVAPETASALPLIALVGLAALSVGTVLLAGRDRA